MSQPTRARTTGGARKPRKESRDSASLPAGQEQNPTNEPAAERSSAPFAPETLARTLRAVAAELERDPALARRVADAVTADTAPTSPSITQASPPEDAGVGASGGRPSLPGGRSVASGRSDTQEQTDSLKPRLNRTFRPKLVPGAGAELGAGIPDPFALMSKLGADGLRAALDELRLGTLRAIVREHNLDPRGILTRQNDAEKLRAAILTAASKPHR